MILQSILHHFNLNSSITSKLPSTAKTLNHNHLMSMEKGKDLLDPSNLVSEQHHSIESEFHGDPNHLNQSQPDPQLLDPPNISTSSQTNPQIFDPNNNSPRDSFQPLDHEQLWQQQGEFNDKTTHSLNNLEHTTQKLDRITQELNTRFQVSTMYSPPSPKIFSK